MKRLSVKELYKRWSEYYDSFNRVIFLEGNKPIKALVKIKGKRILDCGCGTGRNAINMANKGAKVTGIDFSKEMLELAKKKTVKSGLKIEFLHMDILKKWRFKNNSFDGILCNLVFNHIKNPLFVLKEMKRVSKKGATVVITDIHPFAFYKPQIYQKEEYNDFCITPKIKVKTYGFRHLISDIVNSAKKTSMDVLEIKEFFVTKKLKKLSKKHGWGSPTRNGALGVMYVFRA